MRDNKDKALSFAIVCIFVVWTVKIYWGNWPVDLSALYFAAYFFDAGAYELVYAPDGQAFWRQAHLEWRELAHSQGYYSDLIPAYIYPPLWTALLGPVARAVDFVSFANAFFVLFIGSILGMIGLAYAIAGRIAASLGKLGPPIWVFCLSGAFVAGFTSYGALSFQLGQPQIIVSFLMMLSLHLLIAGRDLSAGGVLALAAAIKLMPTMLVIVFVFERRWRALFWFLGIGGALGLLSIFLCGWPLHQALLVRIDYLGNHVSVSRLSTGFETLAYHLENLWHGFVFWDISGPSKEPKSAFVSLFGRAVLFFGLVGVWWTTREIGQSIRIWLRFTLVLALVNATSPLAWLHYMLLPAMLALVAYGLIVPQIPGIVLFAMAVLTSLPVYLFFAFSPIAGFGEVYLHFSLLVVTCITLLQLGRNQRE
ncbi:glycosyltransferase family 87 protein [Aliiroseovarius sp. F20344]|uniref:glycosyltransferase family 87 protein n=1 Tax=Aliiroseovarius sp. F20344 TaxID=2926414 RepID=UPI001FF3B708|nr:glycosyltransferase family 87 protein [Aliiroseovarius sp. F20344]MCK0141637.1 DUF2029 domain-containing protein [Aliiroseovarius sp. F20344]